MNKSVYIHIRIFTAKGNEDLKQVTCVNYTLNEFKRLSTFLEDFVLLDNCKAQQCFVMIFTFGNWNSNDCKLFFSLKCTFELEFLLKSNKIYNYIQS